MKYEISDKYEIAAAIIKATTEKEPVIKLIENVPAEFQIVEIESDEYEMCDLDEKERIENLEWRFESLERKLRMHVLSDSNRVH